VSPVLPIPIEQSQVYRPSIRKYYTSKPTPIPSTPISTITQGLLPPPPLILLRHPPKRLQPPGTDRPMIRLPGTRAVKRAARRNRVTGRQARGLSTVAPDDGGEGALALGLGAAAEGRLAAAARLAVGRSGGPRGEAELRAHG
jgi:hypothetical protein